MFTLLQVGQIQIAFP